MSGQQAIIDKIILESEELSKEIVKQAKAESEKILAAAREEHAESKALVLERAKQSADELVQGRLSGCDLQIRREALAVRHSAVEQAFDQAKSKILNLGDKEYLAHIRKLIKAYAEDGDVVVIGKSDAKRITAEFVEGIAKEAGIKLTLDKTPQAFTGGVILKNANWDKNLTIDCDFRLLREKVEFEVSKMLEEKK